MTVSFICTFPTGWSSTTVSLTSIGQVMISASVSPSLMPGSLNPRTMIEFHHVADAVFNLDYAVAAEVLRGVQRVMGV